jgi:hypothetical protein
MSASTAPLVCALLRRLEVADRSRGVSKEAGAGQHGVGPGGPSGFEGGLVDVRAVRHDPSSRAALANVGHCASVSCEVDHHERSVFGRALVVDELNIGECCADS